MEKQRILIVEDDPIQGELLIHELTRFGFEAVGGSPAKTVESAINFLKKYPVDLALLDIKLIGDDLGGIKVGTYIMAHHDIPFIYLTQQDNPNVVEEARETRYTSFLVKPHSEKMLKRAIEDALLPPGQKHDNVPDENSSTQVEYKKGRVWCWVKKDREFYKVIVDDIYWIEGDGSYSTFHTFPDGKSGPEVNFTVSHALGVTEKALGNVPDLVRINQSFIINITKIERRAPGESIYVTRLDKPQLIKSRYTLSSASDFYERFL